MHPGSERLERAARSLGQRDVARRHQEILALFPLEARRRLRGVEGDEVLIEAGDEVHRLPLGQVESARLVPELSGRR